MDLKLAIFSTIQTYNLRSIIEHINNGRLHAKPCLVVTNNKDSEVLKVAKEWEIPSHVYVDDDTLLRVLSNHSVNMIILAGYFQKISEKVISKYPGRILNLHPSLLPLYGGKGMYGNKVHEAVLEDKMPKTGISIHIVDSEDYDTGPVIAREVVPIFPSDTVETLAERSALAEQIVYPRVLEEIFLGRIKLRS
jgi:phosphoribosylglycinamide formyltransferase 1